MKDFKIDMSRPVQTNKNHPLAKDLIFAEFFTERSAGFPLFYYFINDKNYICRNGL